MPVLELKHSNSGFTRSRPTFIIISWDPFRATHALYLYARFRWHPWRSPPRSAIWDGVRTFGSIIVRQWLMDVRYRLSGAVCIHSYAYFRNSFHDPWHMKLMVGTSYSITRFTWFFILELRLLVCGIYFPPICKLFYWCLSQGFLIRSIQRWTSISYTTTWSQTI